MGEWLHQRALEGLFAYTKSQFSGEHDWRSQEACLYLFNMLISDLQDRSEAVPPEVAQAHMELIDYAIGKLSATSSHAYHDIPLIFHRPRSAPPSRSRVSGGQHSGPDIPSGCWYRGQDD